MRRNNRMCRCIAADPFPPASAIRFPRLGRVVSDLLSAVIDRASAGLYYAWDPLAAAALLDRSVLRTELRLDVELDRTEQGRVLLTAAGAIVEVAVGADPVRFRAAFLGAFEKR